MVLIHLLTSYNKWRKKYVSTLYTYDLKNINVILLYQANPERKYNNKTEVMDDMVNNVFTCMQELEINPGNIIYFTMRISFKTIT